MICAWETGNLYYDEYGWDVIRNRVTTNEWIPYLQAIDLSYFLEASNTDDHQTFCNIALFLGRGVCYHFSDLFSYLCALDGLDCYQLVGPILVGNHPPSWEEHAWNAVSAGGEWKYVDATFRIFRKAPQDFLPTRVVDTVQRYERPVAGSDAGLLLKTFPASDPLFPEAFRSLSKKDIEVVPFVPATSYLYEMGFGLQTFDHRQYAFASGKSLEMEFPTTLGDDIESTISTATLKADFHVHASRIISFQGGAMVAKWEFPQSGVYLVRVGFRTKDTPTMTTVITYEVTVQ